MSDWDVHLVFEDGKSAKFWRARVEGSTLMVNYGRIGSDGQTNNKELGSEEACRKEMDKLAGSKKRKGYEVSPDADAQAPAPVVESAVAIDTKPVDLSLDTKTRKARVKLSLDGNQLSTEVVEEHASEEDAAAALGRVRAQLQRDGYKVV